MSNVTITTPAELVAAYSAASDPKSRAAVRKIGQQRLDAELMREEFDQDAIRGWNAALKSLRVEQAVRETVPDEVKLAARIASLRHAANLLESGAVRPEGMGEVDLDLVQSHLEGELSEDEIAAATKLAQSKITRSTERNSIMDAIERAFDGKSVGTVLKISEVVRGGKTDSYTPSPGAVVAHFDRETTRNGFRFLPGDAAGNKNRIEYVGE